MEVTGEDVIRGLQRMKDDRDVQTESELPVAPPALPPTAPQSIRRALRLIQGGKR
jgi:hypothetical protein